MIYVWNWGSQLVQYQEGQRPEFSGKLGDEVGPISEYLRVFLCVTVKYVCTAAVTQ